MLLDSKGFERLTQYLKKEKNPLIAGYYLGKMAFVQGQLDEARKHWGKVAQKEPLNFDDGHDLWAEATLRVESDTTLVADTIYQLISTQRVTMRGALLLAVAEIRYGESISAHTVLKAYMKGLGAELNPDLARLELEDWELFIELVPDDTDIEPFKVYFKTEEIEA